MAKKRNNRNITANSTVFLTDQALLLDVTNGAFQLDLPDTTQDGIEPGYVYYFIPTTGDFSLNPVTIVPHATDGTSIGGNPSILITTDSPLILELFENGQWINFLEKSSSNLPLNNGAAAYSMILDNGQSNQATGINALAYGANAQASAFTGLAWGNLVKSNGTNYSIALQLGTEASNNQAFATGAYTKALGPNSSAFGNLTQATKANSSAKGWSSKSTGYASDSSGIETEAKAQASTSEGGGTIAGIADGGTPNTGSYSHAQNLYTYAAGEASHTGGAGVFNDGDIKRVTASGYAAFNHSEVDATDDGTGAAGRGSAILGGKNNKIQDSATYSVILGGENIDGNKANYVYAPNIEIHGGIAEYTVNPTSNPNWGNRSLPDKAYVDLVGNPTWTDDTNLVTNIAFDKYKNNLIDGTAEINLSLITGGYVRHYVRGKVAYVLYDFTVDAENISVDPDNLSFAFTIGMPYLPTTIKADTRAGDYTMTAVEVPGPGSTPYHHKIEAKAGAGLDFGKSLLNLTSGQHYQIRFQGQIFFELT